MTKSKLQKDLNTSPDTDPNQNYDSRRHSRSHDHISFHDWLSQVPIPTSSATRLDYLYSIVIILTLNIFLPLLIALITRSVLFIVWHFSNTMPYPAPFLSYLPMLYLFLTALALPVYVIFTRQLFAHERQPKFKVTTIRSSKFKKKK